MRGPGQVVFGDNVLIGMRVTPWTYAADARIVIGNNVFINGTRFACRERISVGDRCILAEAHLMDTDFHSTHANRHDPAAPVRIAPIELAENVWVCASAGLLPGTTVGRDSVIGFGAVCSGSYPASTLIAGNPGRAVREIPGGTAALAPSLLPL